MEQGSQLTKFTHQDRTYSAYELAGYPTSATSRKTRSDLNIFYYWLQARPGSEVRLIENIAPEELDPLLVEMYGTLRAKHGAEYDPKSLKSIRNSIERHLRDQTYPVSTIYSSAFTNSQEAYKRRTGQLMHEQLLSKEELLSVKQTVFSEEYLQSKNLVTCLLWMNSFHFPDSLKTKNDHLSLLWGDIELKTDLLGQESLSLTVAASSKKPGRTLLSQSLHRVCADTDSPEHCPIKLYKFYATNRPHNSLDEKSKFYLQPAGLTNFCSEGLTLRGISATFKYLKQLALPAPSSEAIEATDTTPNQTTTE